ncbi:hypothetical protein LCGC14_0297600 [marine sediment metagenome]|uniref:Uncharacterized protein n=1 Tax=marine sediment metagenome TaxID=412755 RepID=A0A0F9U837_9ZZZZ
MTRAITKLDELPELPPGFTLDEPMPPLPEGFTLDTQPALAQRMAQNLGITPGEKPTFPQPTTPQTLGQATGGALVHGAAGTAAGLLRTGEREERAQIKVRLARGIRVANWLHGKSPEETEQQIQEAHAQLDRPTILSQTAGQIEQWRDEHPEWAPEQVDNALQLITNPKALAGNLSAMIPYMAATTAAFLTAGPAAAGLVAYGVESDSAYQEAIAGGATEEQAQTAARITGTINAVIELAQVGRWLKFGKRGGRALFAREITRRAKAKMLTGMAAKLAIEEGLEEVAQGTTEDLVALGVYDRPVQDFWKNRSVELVLGSVGGLFMGGASLAAQAAIAQTREVVPTVEPTPIAPTPEPIPVEPPPAQPAAPAPPVQPAPSEAVAPTKPAPAAPSVQSVRSVQKAKPTGDISAERAQKPEAAVTPTPEVPPAVPEKPVAPKKAPVKEAAKPPTEAPVVEGKQPWEMTDSEIKARRDEGYASFLDFAKDGKDILRDHKKYGRIGVERKWAVESAVRKGKPVPAKVLKEYAGEKWADEALANLGGKPTGLSPIGKAQRRGLPQEAPVVEGKVLAIPSVLQKVSKGRVAKAFIKAVDDMSAAARASGTSKGVAKADLDFMQEAIEKMRAVALGRLNLPPGEKTADVNRFFNTLHARLLERMPSRKTKAGPVLIIDEDRGSLISERVSDVLDTFDQAIRESAPLTFPNVRAVTEDIATEEEDISRIVVQFEGKLAFSDFVALVEQHFPNARGLSTGNLVGNRRPIKFKSETAKPGGATFQLSGVSPDEFLAIARKPIPSLPEAPVVEGKVDTALTRKREQLAAAIEKIEKLQEGYRKTDDPGTAVTGRSGISRVRTKRIAQQRDRTIDLAVRSVKLREDLERVEAQIKAQRGAPKREAAERGATDRLTEQFDTIEVGDLIDVGGNTPLRVIKKNRKTVITDGGSKWGPREIVGVTKKEVPVAEPKPVPPKRTIVPKKRTLKEAVAEKKAAKKPNILQLRKQAKERGVDVSDIKGPGAAVRIQERVAKPPVERITDADHKKALKTLEDTRLLGGTPLSAEQKKAAGVVGLYHYEQGLRKFGEWKAAIKKDVGEEVTLHLPTIWKHIKPGRVRLAAIEKAAKQAARIPPSKIKRGVREIIKPAEEEVRMTPRQLLVFALKHEAKAARKGFRAGQLDMAAQGADVAKFATEHLPVSERGKVLKTIAKARTPAEWRAVVRAVNRIIENYDRAEAFREFKEAQSKIDRRHMEPVTKAKVDALLDSFAVSQPAERTLRRARSLIDAYGRDELGEIPQQLVGRAESALERAGKVPLRKLTPDAIREVATAINTLVHLNATKNRMRFSKKYKDANKAVAEASQNVLDRHHPKHQTEIGKFEEKRLQRWVVQAATWHQLSPDTKSFILGGEDSAVYDLLFEGPREGQEIALGLTQQMKDYSDEAYSKAGITSGDIDKMSAEVGGKDFDIVKVTLPTATSETGARVESIEMTKGERARFLWTVKDPQNRAELLRDKQKGITFRRTPGQNPVKLRAKDIVAIENSATKEERAVVDIAHDIVNKDELLRGPLNEAWRSEFGFDIAQRDNYSPRRRDPEFRKAKADPNKIMQEWFNRQLEQQGIFKTRAVSNDPFIIGDIFVDLPAHIARVASFVGKGGPTHDAARLLQDQGFRKAVRSTFKHGDALLLDIEKTLKDYRGLNASEVGIVARIVKGAIRRSHIGALGLKLQIVLYQTVSYLNATNEIDARILFSPKTTKLAFSKGFMPKMREVSPTLRARHEASAHEILTPGASGSMASQFWGITEEGVLGRAGMKPIHAADSLVMRVISAGAYREGEAKGLSGDALWEHAAKRARQIIDRTQPTWGLLTTSSIHREARHNVFVKLAATMFSSQRNKNLNMAARATSEYRHSKKTAVDQAKAARKILVPTLVNAVMIAAIAKGYSWLTGKLFAKLFGTEEDEKGWGNYALLVSQRLFGSWLAFGDIASEIVRAAVAGLLDIPEIFIEHRPNILAQAASDTVSSIASLSIATEKYIKADTRKGQDAAFRGFIRAAEKGTRAATVLGGIPAGGVLQLERMARRAKARKPKGGVAPPTRATRRTRPSRGRPRRTRR